MLFIGIYNFDNFLYGSLRNKNTHHLGTFRGKIGNILGNFRVVSRKVSNPPISRPGNISTNIQIKFTLISAFFTGEISIKTIEQYIHY